MADNEAPPPIRLMTFVSEDQLEEARRTRGPRVEDGTAQRDRPLYEILQENKDKKDAEFNERFKHRPPKALDEDETEFLDKYEMSKRQYERQMADEEEQELRTFQAAVESQSQVVHELKETPSLPKVQDKKSAVGKKNRPARSLGMVIKVKPQAKKAKVEAAADLEETATGIGKKPGVDVSKSSLGNFGLVSYSDESEDDDD
ncbi:hypothetical protein ABFS82_04G001200 [Erythranthe guttata]|uniref:FAM192A/Fyv6 N-terminal domain-containing protein n=1 Tax=Erythranthe guttata TaxID=4155 RepID=A0A022S3P0_ERYGU|nr:PREDICTED: protein FAM192A isoform X2 [Erythranthe guttata]EYU46881.1 hypothetical protein MIMGU_mgv1a014041mg [Erythranthe guttata]|eukprot:XP_012834927.1 PREDICTED: protein FAM192A isoform X2 [Erythranthe guttata]